jgi:hypothetical protein
MAKKSLSGAVKTLPPRVTPPKGRPPKPEQEPEPIMGVASVPSDALEGVRLALQWMLTAFPGTPKIVSPEPAGFIWGPPPTGGPPVPAIVSMITNKISAAHRMTVIDLTDATNVIPPQTIPAPMTKTFAAMIPGMHLKTGHEYRIRIEVDPAAAGPNDEFDTVYVTAI